MENKLDMGHARLAVAGERTAIFLANKIVLEGLSVREAEKLAQKQMHEPERTTKENAPSQPRYTTLQEEMSACLGTRVEIKPAIRRWQAGH